MKFFILEDDPRRMVYFRERFLEYGIIYHFTDVDPALDFLQDHANEMDFLFLDHDLGGETYVNSNEYNTGYTIAKYLRGIKDFDYSKVIIHSMNTVGSRKMMDCMPGSVIIPFHAIFERIVVN